nr:hypothetical protein [Tanacetum cinerariifolium]
MCVSFVRHPGGVLVVFGETFCTKLAWATPSAPQNPRRFLGDPPDPYYLHTPLRSLEGWDAGPTDGANVEANLRGPVGLSKWALIFVIVHFNLDPLEVLLIQHDTNDSGPDISFDISAYLGYVSRPAKVLLIQHDTNDSGPDISFDISAYLGYVSRPAKVISHVSPSKVPK